MGSIITQNIIEHKTPKEIARHLGVSVSSVYQNLKKHIDYGYITLSDGRYQTTQAGREMFQLVSMTSKTKRTRFVNANRKNHTGIVSPDKYFNRFVYNLGDNANLIGKEKRAVIINIINKIKTLNETNTAEFSQTLFLLFSEPLKAKPKHLKAIMSDYIKEREQSKTPINNPNAYILATLIDWYTCGWDKFHGYWLKKLEKKAPRKLKQNAAEYVSYFFVNIEDEKKNAHLKRKFKRTLIADWYYSPKTYTYKIKKIQTKRQAIKVRNYNVEINIRNAAAADKQRQQAQAFDKHWATLPDPDKKRSIDMAREELIKTGAPVMMIRENMCMMLLRTKFVEGKL